MKLSRTACALSLLVGFSALGCNGHHDSGVGASCSAAEQCFVGLAREVEGAAQCLDRIEGGYCTHECDTDADCCAVAGECPSGREEVCAPFESTGMRLCFLSCEGRADGDAYCGQYAHLGFGCRSTGGGAKNRKVCVP